MGVGGSNDQLVELVKMIDAHVQPLIASLLPHSYHT